MTGVPITGPKSRAQPSHAARLVIEADFILCATLGDHAGDSVTGDLPDGNDDSGRHADAEFCPRKRTGLSSVTAEARRLMVHRHVLTCTLPRTRPNALALPTRATGGLGARYWRLPV